jgi:beta-glucosidase
MGDVNPSAKLPVSFPRADNQTWIQSVSQYPGTEQPGTSEPRYIATYSEGLEMGYRWFDAKDEEPLFAFGDGMSYTTFELQPGYIAVATAGPPGAVTATVTCKVTNTGATAGSVVAQLYLGYPKRLGEPIRQLRGFEKVHLEPQASAQVTFALTARDLSFFNTTLSSVSASGRGQQQPGDWAQPAGDFTVSVGFSSRDLPLTGLLNLNGSMRTV